MRKAYLSKQKSNFRPKNSKNIISRTQPEKKEFPTKKTQSITPAPKGKQTPICKTIKTDSPRYLKPPEM
jgi:hypothetical protein